ncbi:MAG: metallophosphoesterase family protein [Candidatus Omnitrophica bacterium]|nr:metallophosphoesterase family protein [Candidatus Omnitrophota bacterium]
MIYVILSDIHSNIQAFDAVVKSIHREKDVSIICAGDVIGYGANPVECINVMRENNIKSVLGNHDAALVGKMDISRLVPHAREAINWTNGEIKKKDVDYLDQLPFVLSENEFQVVHGTLDAPEEFVYLTSSRDASRTFETLKKRICFVGHTHRPGAYMEMDGKIYQFSKKEIILDDDANYIINVGSVGQPRDYDNRASYCVYYPTEGIVEFRRVKYDIKSAKSAITKAGLPESLGERLLTGW